MTPIPMVIETSNNVERSFDIFSSLHKDRIVFLNGQVEDHMANVLVAQLLKLDADQPGKDIDMYINSPGGVVTAGLAIHDTMQYIKSHVRTICMGQACSMGSFLLMSGAPGKRMILPNARVMVHQPSGGYSGQVTDIQIHARESAALKERLTKTYVDYCGGKYDEWYDRMERDCFLGADEAKELGLVDEVIELKR